LAIILPTRERIIVDKGDIHTGFSGSIRGHNAGRTSPYDSERN
jgi:hypothetical protein